MSDHKTASAVRNPRLGASKHRVSAFGAPAADAKRGHGAVAAAVLGELQELAERMACTAVDAQKDHPIGFRR